MANVNPFRRRERVSPLWVWAILFFFVGLVLFRLSPLESLTWAKDLLINLTASCFELAAGLIIVNWLLGGHERTEAKGALLVLAEEPLGKLSKMIEVDFGRARLDDWRRRYDGDNAHAAFDNKDGCLIVASYLSKLDAYAHVLLDAGAVLDQLPMVIGWSMDPDLLVYAFSARKALRRFEKAAVVGDDAQRAKASGYLMDLYLYTELALERLSRA